MRAVLQREFDRRRARNARYSLRAFALLLSADHSTLSQILRGTRKPTTDQIRCWAQKLGLDEEEATAYVLADSAPEALSVLTDRTHWEILRLCSMPDFRPDCRWIAEHIGSGVDQINIALSRLLRLGLLEMSAHGGWSNVANLRTEREFRTCALARVQKQL